MSKKEKLVILFKILFAMFGATLCGFGILCYMLTFISSSYEDGVGSAILTELSQWNLSFMLNSTVQLVVIFGGFFIALIMIWSILKDYDQCT